MYGALHNDRQKPKEGNMLRNFHAVCLALLSGLVATPALAATPQSIVIVNPGFEAFPLGPDEFSRQIAFGAVLSADPIPGWALSPSFSDAGTQHMTASQYAAGVPDGDNAAYVSRTSNVIGWGLPAGEFISQALSSSAQPDTQYSLSVMVGQRADYGLPAGGGYFVHLGTTQGDLLAAASGTTQDVAPGTFREVELTFSTSDNPEFVGRQFVIYLGLWNPDSSDGQVNFDNVTMFATAVPEPASIALMLGGLCAVGGTIARRRRGMA